MLKSSRLRYPAWCLVLVLIAFFSGRFIIRAFHPGGFNDDMVFQLRQAQGQIPFNDWHPVVQALVWKWLIELTGDFSSLLTVQVVIFELAAFGLSLYIYLLTRKPLLSLLGFAVLFVPWTLTFAGMLWKDSGMTACLFLVMVLGLYIGRYLWLKWPLLVIAIILLIYATMVRKNAAFAVLPLLWYLWCQTAAGTRMAPYAGRLLRRPLHRLRSLPKRRFAGLFAVSIVFAGLVVGGSAGVDALTKPERTDQVTQVYLDDLSFTLTDKQINREPMPERLRTDLRGIRAMCPLDGSKVVSNVYWRCYRNNDPNLSFHAIDDADAIQKLWIHEVSRYPVVYLRYRTLVYAHFLFDTNYKYDAKWEGLPPEVAKTNPIQNQILQVYVQHFGIGSLSWTFQVWFWLGAAITGCVFSGRLRHFRRIAVCLSASSLIYLMGYFPIVPAYNFRYAYWPAVAMTVVGVLAFVAWRWERARHVKVHAAAAHRRQPNREAETADTSSAVPTDAESDTATAPEGETESALPCKSDESAELTCPGGPVEQTEGHRMQDDGHGPANDLGASHEADNNAGATDDRSATRKPMRLSLNRRDD